MSSTSSPAGQAGRTGWGCEWGRTRWQQTSSPCFSSQGFHFKQSLFPASACIKISGHEGESPLSPLTSLSLILQWTTRVQVSLSGRTIRLCLPCCPSNWYLTFTDISPLTRQDSNPTHSGAVDWTVVHRPLRQKSSDRTCVADLTLKKGRSRAVTRVQPS